MSLHDTSLHDIRLSRRAMLKGTGRPRHRPLSAGRLRRCAQSGAARAFRPGDGASAAFAPNAFVRIGTDDTVTVLIKHIEFGQGPFTGLATLVAEELDADWSQMRAEHAPSNPELYKNLAFGVQGTGGSTAIANSYEQMRKAGATARAMLVRAAARGLERAGRRDHGRARRAAPCGVGPPGPVRAVRRGRRAPAGAGRRAAQGSRPPSG